jgi:valyl-tRNA synthetase
MKDYQLSYAFGDLYEFIWHRFADYYIETLKEELKNGNIEVYSALESVYIETLRMLHPFIPFVTDAVHSQFGYGHVLEYKQQTSSS